MKKLFIMLMAVCFMLPVANAQDKQMQKLITKQVKKKVKELEKEGYKIFGSTRTVEMALTKHYTTLETEGDKVTEVVGFSKAKSHNLASMAAQNAAANKYASDCGKQVKGRVLSDMALNSADESEEFEKFYAAYEGKVEQEIRGELRSSFAVKKDNPDGSISVEAYYIVNEDAASRARIKAFKNSMAESAAAQKYAEKVSDFVNERVSGEE